MDFEPRFPSLFFKQRLNATVLPMLGGISLFLVLPRSAAIAVLLLLSVTVVVFAFFKAGERRKTLLCFLAGLSLALALMGVEGLRELRLEKLCHAPHSAEGYVVAKGESFFDVALYRLDERGFCCLVRVETAGDWKQGEKRHLTLTFHSPNPESARDEGIRLLAKAETEGEVVGKSFLYSAVGRVRSRLFSEFSSFRNGGFLSAVLLGERSGLTDAQNTAFRRTASSHILAISGLHVSQTIAFLVCLLRLFPIPRNWVRVLLYPCVLVLFLLAGAGVSVFRAGVMTLFAMTGVLLRYRTDSTTALCFSAALLVLSNPYAVESPSFLLSYASTFGLTTCGMPLTEYLREKFTKKGMHPVFKFLQTVILSLAIASVSFIFTMPVQLLLFETASPFAPLYAILLIPLFQLALILTLAGALSLPMLPDAVSSVLLRVSAAFPDLVEFLSSGAPVPLELGDFSVPAALCILGLLALMFYKKAPITSLFLLHALASVFLGAFSLMKDVFM